MKPSLFHNLCRIETLYHAWKLVKGKNSAGGVDGLSVAQYEDNLELNLLELSHELLEKRWVPEPYLNVQIRKNDTEKRKLGLLTVKDKIVQQGIKMLLEPRLEKIFSNHSYGYRPERGPVKAIHRVSHILRQYREGWMVKLDIDNFFDTIDQTRLLTRLDNFIKDQEFVRLIEICLKMGSVCGRVKWSDTQTGVPQGAILSPLLANFYLHPFDQFMMGKTSGYIRYADDFLIIGRSKEELDGLLEVIARKLETDFLLKLNEPLFAGFREGLEFLGVTVSLAGIDLSEKKKTDLIQRIDSIQISAGEVTLKSRQTLQGIQAYYARLIPQSVLRELDAYLIGKVHKLIGEHRTEISSKERLSSLLRKLEYFAEVTNLSRSVLLKEYLETYDNCLSTTTRKTTVPDTRQIVRRKKQEYRKREIEGTELVVQTSGSLIGVSAHGIVVRQKGKPTPQKTSRLLRHITIVGQGVSVTNYAIQYCSQHRIPIDYFDAKGKHYASVTSPLMIDSMLWSKQFQLPELNRSFLAAVIIEGKLKNQRSLIKYYHKYHKARTDILNYKYPEAVQTLEKCIERVKNKRKLTGDFAARILAQEAVGAVAYWDYIRLLLSDDGVDFHARVRQGASDLMNSMLNYGYAILYSRVWHAVLARKLNAGLSVLHTPQPGKPTLVYDIVELFRSQAVDRIVISLIQKGKHLRMKDDLLCDETKQVLIQAVLERMNRYENYRGEEIQFKEIIKRQVREIAQFISGESPTFKPYVAKW